MSAKLSDPLLDAIEHSLQINGASEANLHLILDKVLSRFGCVVGTIHRLDSDSGMLELVAQRGVPAQVVDQVRVIPIGKGMAGLAAERQAPVQVCNLQTDDSGVAKARAKETRMEGSIAAPMLVDETLRGTLGVAKPAVYEFTPVESELLLQIGSTIAKHLE